MIGSGIQIGRSSRCLLLPLIILLLYMAMSMGISLLSVSDSFAATVVGMLLVIVAWLVRPVAVVIYIVSKIASRQWRLAFSGVAAIGFIIGISPLLSIIDLEIRLAERMPGYLKILAELPPAEREFHAFDWGGWAGGTDKFFIYTSNPSALLLGKPALMGDVLQWSNEAQMKAVCAGRSLKLRARFFYCDPFAG